MTHLQRHRQKEVKWSYLIWGTILLPDALCHQTKSKPWWVSTKENSRIGQSISHLFSRILTKVVKPHPCLPRWLQNMERIPSLIARKFIKCSPCRQGNFRIMLYEYYGTPNLQAPKQEEDAPVSQTFPWFLLICLSYVYFIIVAKIYPQLE